MVNVLIPMAGSGSRFRQAGYVKPKPFIDVAGQPMIVRVLHNLALPNARYILVGQEEHLIAESDEIAKIKNAHQASFVGIHGLTEGTACTVLYARHLIDNDEPLIIANSDQIVDIDLSNFFNDCCERNLDGSILTFKDDARDPKWSFARLNQDGLVVEVKEKQAISDYATVGIYLFKRGSDFVDAAIEMMLNQDRVNGEYYTCPVYNYLIRSGKKVGVFNIAKSAMHGIGTPDDLNTYLQFMQKKS